MKRFRLACAALLSFSPLTGAFAQGSFSIPAGNDQRAAAIRDGHGDGHRPFFYWLTDDASPPAPAAPVASEKPAATVMKTGSSIGTK